MVPEEDSVTDLEVKREEWKTVKKVVMKKWEVRAAVTEVNIPFYIVEMGINIIVSFC